MILVSPLGYYTSRQSCNFGEAVIIGQKRKTHTTINAGCVQDGSIEVVSSLDAPRRNAISTKI